MAEARRVVREARATRKAVQSRRATAGVGAYELHPYGLPPSVRPPGGGRAAKPQRAAAGGVQRCGPGWKPANDHACTTLPSRTFTTPIREVSADPTAAVRT